YTTTLPPLLSLSLPSPPALHPLHSFPTRRSSDLSGRRWITSRPDTGAFRSPSSTRWRCWTAACCNAASSAPVVDAALQQAAVQRSEEHTSELQSRFDLVCRLLLEKKKNNKKTMML